MQTESLSTTTRRLLSQYCLRARKRLAQHFLVSDKVLRQILAAAELSRDDTVVEIGPGLGVLTRQLARQAGRVVAVELDDKLVDILRRELAEFSNVTVIHNNILNIPPGSLFPAPAAYKVVANLPYYITSPVLRHFLDNPARPRLMVVMVQKEVARVIAAEPGEMSLLSVGVQLYGKPHIVAYVPARAFYPAPEVDSAILRIDVYPAPPVAVDEKGFFEVVRAGFSAARKQIINSLAHRLGLPKSEVIDLLGKAGIEATRRAETLTIQEWARLWQAYEEKKQAC